MSYIKQALCLLALFIFVYSMHIMYRYMAAESLLLSNNFGYIRSTKLQNEAGTLRFIQRSSLPRRSNFISSTSDDPLSQFYTVWNTDVPLNTRKSENNKTVVIWNPWPTMWKPACRSLPQCVFTTDRGLFKEADAIIFWFRKMPTVYSKDYFPQVRPSHQYWVIRISECPHLTRNYDWVSYGGVFNWTMTYRNDSDVVTPAGHISRLYAELGEVTNNQSMGNIFHEKKLIVWYVSNCYRYLPRFAYTTELMKYIQVDVFGNCGNDYCGRGKMGRDCFPKHIRQYKFYLAFENSKCIEYITEKFWRNALRNDVVPVVLGAPKSDYVRFAPPNSFIHVDDFTSPMELADYLRYVSQNEDKYLQYLAWKTKPPKSLHSIYEGECCAICKEILRVSPYKRKVYSDLDKWWRGPNYEFCEPLVYFNNLVNSKLAIHFN